MLTLREATLHTCDELAPFLRKADREELWASSLVDPRTALRRSLAVSPEALEARWCGQAVCMWGVGTSSVLGERGSPWLLATDQLTRDLAIPFLRISRRWILDVSQRWGYLCNYADARNTQSIAWLEWLGFRIHPPEPHGPLGLPFHFFDMGDPDV